MESRGTIKKSLDCDEPCPSMYQSAFDDNLLNGIKEFLSDIGDGIDEGIDVSSRHGRKRHPC